MGSNVFQISSLNASLFFTDTGIDQQPPYGGQVATELPLVPDNLNRNLINFTHPMGTWTPYTQTMFRDYQSESSRQGGCWWQPQGQRWSYAARSQGAFFSRVVVFVDEISKWGYVGGMVGGLVNPWYSFDGVNGNAVDYEPIYGHGAASWPMSIDGQTTQFRNASSLPSDGSSRIDTTGSAWTRSNRLHSVYYTIHVLQGGTVASGGIQVIVEQRPPTGLTRGGQTFPFVASAFSIPKAFPGMTQAQYEVLLARVWGHAAALTHEGVAHISSDDTMVAAYPPLRQNDPRTRQGATFNLNHEYYGFVVDSWLLIYTNKASFFPVYAKDLSTIWPAAAHPRIAGIAYDSATLNMWVMSESGELAFIDMSTEGGAVSLKSPATPLLGAGERIGSLVKIGGIIYALMGSYSENMAQPPSTEVVGVSAYTIGANTWSTRHNYTGQARLTGRSLREMIALNDGRLGLLVESVGSGVLVPNTLKIYDSWSTSLAIPADQQTTVVKLAGADLTVPSTSRFRLRYQFLRAHAISATIKRVPAGSPVGTAWTDSAVITHGTATAWDNDTNTIPRTTDWINMPLDPAYDYYVFFYAGIPNFSAACYDGTTGPCYVVMGADPGQVVGRSRSAFFIGDTRNAATVPDLSGGYNGGVWHAAVVDIVNDSGTDTFPGIVNKGLPSYATAWQLLVCDPASYTWNTNVLDNSTSLLCALTDRMHGEMYTPAANKLLIQASPNKDRLFVFDYSGTLDNTKFTDLSWGSAGDIFPSNWNQDYNNGPLLTQELTIVQNTVDSSLLFRLNGAVYRDCSIGSQAIPLGWAWPGFAWDGSEKFQLINPNVFDNNITRNLTKDLLIGCNIGSNHNLNQMMVPCFADTQVTFVHPSYHNQDYALLSFQGAWGGTYYLPRYFKYQGGNWAIAKNWADAASHPMTVPATPDTPVNGPQGLIFLFGPNASTTFLAGEFHTLNLAHGFVKFARRARYTFTVFAGRTYQMTETRTKAALDAVVPVIHHPADVTPSGPAGASISSGVVSWPATDTPMVLTYDFTHAVPAASQLLPSQASASAEYNQNRRAANAISRSVTTNVKDTACWAATGTNAYLRLDMPNTTPARSYRLIVPIQPYPGATVGDMSTWRIEGTVNGSTWDVLHTVSGKSWGQGNPWAGWTAWKGFGMAYMADLTATGNYTAYRVIFPNAGGNLVGVMSLELYSDLLASSVDFSDITLFNDGQGVAVGTSFEVDLGAGFNPITPRYRSHQGEIYSFDRQTGVQQLRITTQYGRYLSTGTRCFGPPQLWDYGTQAVVNAARLGSAAAADATAAKGSYDSQCMGVNTDAIAVSVDGASPQIYTHPWCNDWAGATRGWHFYGPWAVTGTNQFIVHPYFGFIRFADSVVGTSVRISYAWGRRV